MRSRWEWLVPLIPLALAFVLVAVLAETKLIEWHFTIYDVDTALISIGILAAVVSASMFLSREAVRQMRESSLNLAHDEANAERSRFLRRLDHELKNPLMGIQVAVANLAEIDDPAERQRIGATIQTQIVRLTQLVTDLRKIADLGAQPLEQLPIDVGDVLREVWEQLMEQPAAAERDLACTIPDDLPFIRGDRDLLLLAFDNLMNNALKFTHSGDRITLRSRVNGDHIIVEVEDGGIGITPSELPYIWDELYRSSRVREIAGSGIGLALVKLIIQRHGGDVAIQSAPDVGTTVQITLPIVAETNVVTALSQTVSNS